METIWKGKQTNKQTTQATVTKVNKQTNKQTSGGSMCRGVDAGGSVELHSMQSPICNASEYTEVLQRCIGEGMEFNMQGHTLTLYSDIGKEQGLWSSPQPLVSLPSADDVDSMMDCSGCELGRAASFAFWRGKIELQTKLADSRIVDTNFLTNLLGNGFHADADRGVRDVVP